MDWIKGGANKVDLGLGRKGAPRKVGRLRILIANVEDVGGTKNDKQSHTLVWRISSHCHRYPSVPPGDRNCEIETAVWIWPVSYYVL